MEERKYKLVSKKREAQADIGTTPAIPMTAIQNAVIDVLAVQIGELRQLIENELEMSE